MDRKKKKKSKRPKRNELTVRNAQEAQEEVRRLTREKKKADLRLQLARLDAGEDVDLEEHDDEGAPLSGDQAVEGVLGTLGQIGQLMNGMGVEDTTAPGADGAPGLPFQRHAGSVRNIKVDGQGRVKEVDFKPEEWPPRHEKF